MKELKYFSSEKISEHIYRIKDICGVYSYLVVGNEKAFLLDCGYGFGNIREYAETLTDLPIILILTHGHLDHIGASGYFDQVYMNLDDLDVYRNHSDINYRMNHCKRYAFLGELNKEMFAPIKDEKDLIDLKRIETMDAGGVCLKFISVPGHTPGMTCVLIPEDRTILFGDACGVFVLLFDEYSSTVKEYRNSIAKLKQYENDYDFIIRNHGTGESSKVLLDNVIECCDDILNGTDDAVPFNFVGVDLLVAKKFDLETRNRVDGKEGNLAYRKSHIH